MYGDYNPTGYFISGNHKKINLLLFFLFKNIDFNVASKDHQNYDAGHCSFPFASSGLYSQKIRTPMDDLESLVFSLWFVAGIEWDKHILLPMERTPEGKTLAECKKNGNAKAKMIVSYKIAYKKYVKVLT